MKTLKKLLSVVLIIAVSLTSTALLVSASPLHEDFLSDITTEDMNELTARAAVNTYFAERLTFLAGNSESIPSAVSPITNDELLHRNALIDANISYISFSLEFLEINCWDEVAEVTVEETVIYLENLTQKNITVSHEIRLYSENSDTTVVDFDAYFNPIVNFESASYLPPNSETSDPMVVTGSNLCILNIALSQVGYEETPNDITIYGEWYGRQTTWCAIFVAWCAEEASIPTSVIPKTASPWVMMDACKNQRKLYKSAAYGGTYTPCPGDLIFIHGTLENPGHVGLVVSVSGNTVRIVDGNWNQRVCYRESLLMSTDIVGYGHPNYGSSNHSGNIWYSSAAQHYKVCSNCSCAFSHAAHTYRQLNTNSPYICTVCGHTRSYVDIII